MKLFVSVIIAMAIHMLKWFKSTYAIVNILIFKLEKELEF